MKGLTFAFLLGSAFSAIALPLASQAQQGGSLVQTVLAGCPAGAFQSCVPVVNAAIAAFPAGAQRNAELVAVSASLADIARRPQTSARTCLDIAQGIRVAGQAVTDPASSRALLELADSLCGPGFETAATGGDDPPAASLVGGSTGDASPPAPPSSPPSSPPPTSPPPSSPPPSSPPPSDPGGGDNDGDVFDPPTPPAQDPPAEEPPTQEPPADDGNDEDNFDPVTPPT